MRWTILFAVMLLVACGPEPDMPMSKQWRQSKEAQPAPVADNSRIEVTRIGVFADDLAYGSRRGVYIIRDRETGREFLGVSGVGVSELGSHSAGKSRVGDER